MRTTYIHRGLPWLPFWACCESNKGRGIIHGPIQFHLQTAKLPRFQNLIRTKHACWRRVAAQQSITTSGIVTNFHLFAGWYILSQPLSSYKSESQSHPVVYYYLILKQNPGFRPIGEFGPGIVTKYQGRACMAHVSRMRSTARRTGGTCVPTTREWTERRIPR